MKKTLRSLILAALAFLSVALFYQGFKYEDLYTIALAAGVFALLSQFVKPVLKLLALPFNLISFGLMSTFTNIAILYLVALLVSSFKVVEFQFTGFSYSGFFLPEMTINVLLSTIIASIAIGVVETFLQLVFR